MKPQSESSLPKTPVRNTPNALMPSDCELPPNISQTLHPKTLSIGVAFGDFGVFRPRCRTVGFWSIGCVWQMELIDTEWS